MHYHTKLLETWALFVLNTLIVLVYLQLYGTVHRLGPLLVIEEPSGGFLLTWLLLFFGVALWLAVVKLWQQRHASVQSVVEIALYADVPFALLLIVLWLFFPSAARLIPEVSVFLIALVTLFPITIGLAKRHVDGQVIAFKRARRR